MGRGRGRRRRVGVSPRRGWGPGRGSCGGWIGADDQPVALNALQRAGVARLVDPDRAAAGQPYGCTSPLTPTRCMSSNSERPHREPTSTLLRPLRYAPAHTPPERPKSFSLRVTRRGCALADAWRVRTRRRSAPPASVSRSMTRSTVKRPMPNRSPSSAVLCSAARCSATRCASWRALRLGPTACRPRRLPRTVSRPAGRACRCA